MAEPPNEQLGTASSSSPDAHKPAILIIGGLGYIGRFLALYIHKNDLASEVRLVDKVLPQLAWLAPEFAEACSQDKFMQADATREQSLSKIFTPTRTAQYTYVFNCGGETRYSQDDSVYSARSLSLSLTLARECSRRHIPAFVEFSTAMVYKSPSSSTISSGGCTETSPTKPWLKLAKYKLQAEEGLEKIRREAKAPTEQLRYVVLRLAHVYGEYDIGWLARALCLARVYQAQGDEMKWLYGKDLRINTVHVTDVCTAALAAAAYIARTPVNAPELVGPGARVFNIADGGDTSQLILSQIVARIFNISTGFQNSLVSTFAKFNLESVVDDVNEEVLQPWADLFQEKGMVRKGPIGPFMEKELLRDVDLCVNSEKARRVLGWRAGVERLSEDGVRKVVESYQRMGWWP